MTNPLDQLADAQRPGIPDPLEAAEALTELLGLSGVGLKVTGGRIVGHGLSASVDLRLSDKSTITFDSVREMAKPAELTLAVALATGADVSLKAPEARRAVILLRALAEHQETATDDTVATDWGLAFLEAADTVALDMRDQVERYAAFAHLIEIGDRVSSAISARANVAATSLVLEDTSGTRYIRAGWFYAHVRLSSGILAERAISGRMLRVGWQQPGNKGRVKATPAGGLSRPLVWTFFQVPPAWEDLAVNGGERSNAREREAVRAREGNTPPFTRTPGTEAA
jgi:hypothetical protein